MAILNNLKRQLRSVIEWREPRPDTLFYQWSDNGDEIKNVSKLIVNPGQGCIFVYEGKIRSVLDKPCLVELETANIPFWTTIKKFMQSFESEHKVGIYYFRTSKVLNQKWGTLAPIKYEDPKFGFPVALKAFGNFSYRIVEPRDFFVNVVGGHNNFTTTDFRSIMSERLVHPITDHIAELRLSFTEIDAQREEIAQGMAEKLTADFAKLGFEITDFRIEGTNFDEETVRRIGRIADLTAEAQAIKAVGVDYAELMKLEALKEAAKNEGGGAGMGVGLGAGLGMGQAMAQSMTQKTAAAPASDTGSDPAAKLTQLKKMHEEGLITDEEYTAKKKQILDAF
ncbi:MAG: SPFH domain-containing protein [Desulfobacterales bacterium]|nr:SPFH domain-containing protein [Desulfobacterales bacterium]